MCTLRLATIAAPTILLLAGAADGYVIRCRIVERVGTVDTPLDSPNPGVFYLLDPGPGSVHRLRLQVAVFDDEHGPAPAGGVFGWIQGAQTTTDGRCTRTPGRLAHFDDGPLGNGIPASDPFFDITDIDATTGVQTLPWNCDAAGAPLPMPQAVIRGLNTFVSVWEVTVHVGHCSHMAVTFSGEFVVASSWMTVGTPVPPACPTPGTVAYAAVVLPPQPFTCQVVGLLGPPGNPPPCFRVHQNWYPDTVLNSQDFYAFVNDFFSGFADYNCNGVTDSEDLFEFLTAFFAGC